MTDKELMDMILSERINQLLERNLGSNPEIDQGDQFLRGLEEKIRIQIEAYIDKLMEVSAKNERHIYLGGFRDGVKLVLKISGLERRETFREA